MSYRGYQAPQKKYSSAVGSNYSAGPRSLEIDEILKRYNKKENEVTITSNTTNSKAKKVELDLDSDEIERQEQESIMKAQIESLNEELEASRTRYIALQQSSKEEVTSLKLKVRNVQEENERLRQKLKTITGEIEEKMDELDLEQETKGRHLQNYKKWSAEEFVQWIVDIEDGKFKMYESRLKVAFRREGVTGQSISTILRCDWRAWGVTKYADTVALSAHVADLVDSGR